MHWHRISHSAHTLFDIINLVRKNRTRPTWWAQRAQHSCKPCHLIFAGNARNREKKRARANMLNVTFAVNTWTNFYMPFVTPLLHPNHYEDKIEVSHESVSIPKWSKATTWSACGECFWSHFYAFFVPSNTCWLKYMNAYTYEHELPNLQHGTQRSG